MDIFTLHQGTAPLFFSLPLAGTELPDDIAARMNDSARRVPDTDWHVSRLYAFARELGASVIVPKHSRYVVDLNRPPDDESLYPGQNTTGLCPLVQFSNEPIYMEGQEPTKREIGARIKKYWCPYHQALAEEIARIKARHGRVVLWEGHSIRSEVPFLFAGASCSGGLQRKLVHVLEAQKDYSFVANGRFKGGYITRNYGKPIDGIEAIQLELAQCNYMNEQTFEYDEAKASRVQAVIRTLLESV